MAKQGRLWRVDNQGIIQNDAERSHITAPYQQLIQAVIDAYVEHIPDDIHSIYVTGSVPRGLAVEGVSDLDIFAVLESSADPLLVMQDWIEPTEQDLLEKYPMISDIQLELWTQDWVFNDPEEFSVFAFIIKTHSVCVWGSNLASHLPDFTIPDDLVAIANDDIVQIKPDIEEAEEAILEDTSPENVAYWCKRICKNILRTGFALTMMDEKVHTRDIDLAYKYFVKHYPQQADAMKQAWDFVDEPAETAEPILNFLDSFGAWIQQEADRWLDKHNPERHLDYRYEDYDDID